MEGVEDLLGATMPHYAPMMKLGVPVLAAAAQSRKIETVVLLAPNHKGEGPPVELSGSGYFWPDGSVEGDGDAAAFLRKTAVPDAAEDRQILSEEYAASLWAPYIAQLFPGATQSKLALFVNICRMSVPALPRSHWSSRS